MMDRARPASIDAFAETNPAFCSLILSAYVSAFQDTQKRPLPITLLPLVLPIVMSGELDSSFLYTSKDTGLARWISKTPSVLFNLRERVQASVEMSRESLQFALQYQILSLDDEAQISDLIESDATRRLKKLGFEKMGSNARKLGTWVGVLASASVTYNILGLDI